MSTSFQHITQSPLVRNSAKLLSANVIAQAIGLAVYPILTRLYAPEDFGVMNLFCSIAGIVTLFATAEYQSAVVLPREDKDAFNLIRWMGILTGGVFLITTLSIPFSNTIAHLFHSDALSDWYWLMPICVATMAGWNIINFWYIRQKQYRFISRYQYSLSTFSASTKVGMGYAGWLRGGLILSLVFGQLTALFISLWRNHRIWSSLRQMYPFHREEVVSIAKRYRNFPLFNLPRSIVNYISGQLPVLLFMPFFGERCVGFWGMAILLGFAPITMISKALYQVLYGHIAAAQKEGQSVLPFIRRFTIRVICMEVPAMVLLYFILPWMVRWLLGDEWLPTADMLRWMLPWVGVILLSSSTSFFVDLYQQQKVGFYFEIINAVTRLAAIGIGIYCHDITIAVACYALGNFITTTAMFIWQVSLVHTHERHGHTVS